MIEATVALRRLMDKPATALVLTSGAVHVSLELTPEQVQLVEAWLDRMTVCGCCGRGEPEATLRAPLPGWTQGERGFPAVICTDCLRVWYDEGLTDPVEIKRRVLAIASIQSRR